MSRVVFPVAKGRVLRATILDACGIPAWGDFAYLASKGFVSINVTANYDDGTELSQTNADGDKCQKFPAKATLTNLSLSVVFCNVDPELYTLASGQPKILDPATGKVIGFRINTGVAPLDTSWALEVWSYAQGEVACDQETGDIPWAYTVWPFLSGGRVSDYAIANDVVTFGIEQALTKDGSGWGVGPYLVVTDADVEAAMLSDAVDGKDHQIGPVYTTVQPPAETNGLLPLDDPEEAAATGALAGIPGHFTPTGAVRPYDLAQLIADDPTPSPNTNWTTGQHVILGDGSKAKWNATAYIAVA